MSYFTADHSAQLIQPDPGAQFLLVNNDTARPLYISQARGVNRESDQVPAQGSVSLTGWWYASTLDDATTIECFVLPGGSQWSNPVGVQIALSALGLATDASVNNPAYGPPTHADVTTTGPANITGGKKLADVDATLGTPAQTADIGNLHAAGKTIAAEVSTTGVPSLHDKQGLILHNNGGLAIGGNDQLSGSFTRVGYTWWLSADTTLGSQTGMITIKFKWTDTASGDVIKEKWYSWWVGNSASGGLPAGDNIVTGRGPTRGDQLAVSLIGAAGTGIITYQLAIFETGFAPERDYASHRVWGTDTSGRAQISNDIRSGIIGSVFTANLAAGASQANELPLYKGKVRILLNSASAASDAEISFSALDDPNLVLPTGIIYDAHTGPDGNLNDELYLPGIQCFASITNHNAAAKTLKYSIVEAEY